MGAIINYCKLRTSNDTDLFSYSYGGQKSDTDLTGLIITVLAEVIPSGGSEWRESVSLTSPGSRSFLN